MLNLASDQTGVFPPARPALVRRIWPYLQPMLAADVMAGLTSMWVAHKLRARRAAERAELRGAGYQVWHDLGASRVAEEVGKPPSAK